jgi:hypothetical protein
LCFGAKRQRISGKSGSLSNHVNFGISLTHVFSYSSVLTYFFLALWSFDWVWQCSAMRRVSQPVCSLFARASFPTFDTEIIHLK